MPRINPFEFYNNVKRGYNRLVIPTAKVKTLFSSPLLIAPYSNDAGSERVPLFVALQKAAGVAYNLNGNSTLKVQLIGSSTPFDTIPFTLTGFLDQTIAKRYGVRWATQTGTFDENYFGGGIQLALSTADMTIGDGDLTVEIIYEDLPNIMKRL